jgi:hypothetical protein
MELEETMYWLELLEGAGIVSSSRLTSLKTEISELTAIFVTLIRMARSKAKVETRNQKAAIRKQKEEEAA